MRGKPGGCYATGGVHLEARVGAGPLLRGIAAAGGERPKGPAGAGAEPGAAVDLRQGLKHQGAGGGGRRWSPKGDQKEASRKGRFSSCSWRVHPFNLQGSSAG